MDTESIEEVFLSLSWHDAELLELVVDRRAPGERDEVRARIQWENGKRHDVCFIECYQAEMTLNFGVRVQESILEATCVADSPALRDLRRRWSGLGVDLGRLRHFEVVTSSTASVIRVLALNFELIEV